MIDLLQSVVDTAAEIYEPDDAWGLVGLLIIGAPSIVTAAFSGVILWRQRKTDDKLGRVEANSEATVKQVVNGHEGKPALRSDVDRIVTAVEKTDRSLAELRGEVRGLTHRVDQIADR